MTRALVVGAGDMGRQHLAALTRTPGVQVMGVVEPRRLSPGEVGGVPRFIEHRSALATVRPDLVVVACPPVLSLTIAREAAATGALVLVEKPVVINPADLATSVGVAAGASSGPAGSRGTTTASRAGSNRRPTRAGARVARFTDESNDGAISVAFQPHFAPGAAELLASSTSTARAVVRAEIVLARWHDADYYRGWRGRWAQAGGVLHQQAIHSLALVSRLLGHPPPISCIGACHHRRRLADAEDHVTAVLGFASGAEVRLDCRVDHSGAPQHHMWLDRADRSRLVIRGRDLEAGLADPAAAPTHTDLRIALYQALLATASGGPPHPCLFPLRELRPVLETIDYVYRTVHCDPAGA